MGVSEGYRWGGGGGASWGCKGGRGGGGGGASGGCKGERGGGGGFGRSYAVSAPADQGEGSDLVYSIHYTPCSWGAVDTRAPCGLGQLYN